MQFSKCPAVAVNGITDTETFDANQNEFTQVLEKEYWKRFGVSDIFLDQYYSFRKHYKIISPYGSGFTGFQKTSGEPW